MHYKGFPTSEVTQYIDTTMDKEISEVSPDEAENLVIAKYTALGMWMNFPTKDLNCFKDIESEKKFEVKVGDIKLIGICDGLLTYNDCRWVRELKTTGQNFSQFERLSRISSQATAYVYGMRMNHERVEGVIYDYIKKPLLRKNLHEDMHDFGRRIMKDYRERPGIYYRRHYVYRTDQELEVFEQDLLALAKDIKRKLKDGDWYRNTDSCYKYNSECPYYKICHTDNPDPLTVKLYFTKKEVEDVGTERARVDSD